VIDTALTHHSDSHQQSQIALEEENSKGARQNRTLQTLNFEQNAILNQRKKTGHDMKRNKQLSLRLRKKRLRGFVKKRSTLLSSRRLRKKTCFYKNS